MFPLMSWLLLAAAFFLEDALSQPESKFDTCKLRLGRILDGTEIFRGIDNVTVQPYIYRGPVGGMRPEYAQKSRDEFIAITTGGCRAICDDPIDWYWASDPALTLGIISNWILPIIALLAALPYDPGRGGPCDWENALRKAWTTTRGLLNWLGSPQTALTATFFNLHQMRKCLDAAEHINGDADDARMKSLKTDAYYVLCCVGQYELPDRTSCFLEALIYGLFKPIVDYPAMPAAGHNTDAQRWTEQLLRAMAHQMRRSRRLGVWSTCASILLFFVAYAVSVVLAFGDLGERTTTHSLAFGILITWFPLLLFFSILDRNPNSADRTRKFIFRWMWNVRAVKKWEEDRVDNQAQPDSEPHWWSPHRDRRAPRGGGPHHACNLRDGCVPTDFVGQGRHIGYQGLAYSVVNSSINRLEDPLWLQMFITETNRDLQEKPPWIWRWLSVAALMLVWCEIGMAIMISYNIPTVGIGCRSGLCIIYGILSTVPWFAHMFDCLGPRPRGSKWKLVVRFFNWTSTLCLVFSTACLMLITFAAFSGVLKNCTCRGGFSGYIDFENAEFYRDPEHFEVKVWWVAAAVTAAVPVVLSFAVALPFWIWWLRPLWQDSESVVVHNSEEEVPLLPLLGIGGRKADMDWVAY